MKYRITNCLEAIGLLLLLFAFGAQCVEQDMQNKEIKEYFKEIKFQMNDITACLIQEAMDEGRLDEELLTEDLEDTFGDDIYYTRIIADVQTWNELQNKINKITAPKDTYFKWYFVLYILGSLIIVVDKARRK